MREMKDSGIEWVGAIPHNWKIEHIKHEYRILTGNGFPPAMQGAEQGDYPVFKASDISSNNAKTAFKSSNYITKLQARNFNVLPAGSIIFAKIGEALKKNNRTLLAVDACLDNNCQGLVPVHMDSQYSLYLFSCIDMVWFDNGGTVPCVNNVNLLNASIPFPSIEEQHKIATFLNSKCSEIDAISADIQKEIETLEQYKRSVITEAVTKGLNPDAEMKDSGVAWIGKIPSNWNLSKIKYMTTQRDCTGKYNPEKDIFIGLENVVGFTDQYVETSTEYETSVYDVCRKGDILFGRLRPYLAKVLTAPFDGYCTGEFIIFDSFNGCKDYFKYILISKPFIDEVNLSTYGAKMPRANANFILNMYLPLPQMREQERIASFLDFKSSEINALLASKKHQLEILNSYKKSLIYEYVTGKKEVPV